MTSSILKGIAYSRWIFRGALAGSPPAGNYQVDSKEGFVEKGYPYQGRVYCSLEYLKMSIKASLARHLPHFYYKCYLVKDIQFLFDCLIHLISKITFSFFEHIRYFNDSRN